MTRCGAAHDGSDNSCRSQSRSKLALADYLPGSFFTKSERGVFRLAPQKQGEGLNLSDFAATGTAFLPSRLG